MKIERIEHYDDFGDEILFYLDISDAPQSIQDKARQIDGQEYAPCCFGMCVSYDVEKMEFSLAPDEQDTNIYYVRNDGGKEWFMAETGEEFINEVFAACKKEISTETTKERDLIKYQEEARPDKNSNAEHEYMNNKAKSLYLAVIQGDDDCGGFIYQYQIDESAIVRDATIRGVIQDYLKTDEGKQIVMQNDGCFNWGDAVHIPDEFFIQHGLTPVEVQSYDYFVHHDEDLTDQSW